MGDRAERALDLLARRLTHPEDLRDLHLAARDGACLVKAEHVHTRKRLHAVALLDEYAVHAEPGGRDGQHTRGQKHEALRNHAHHGRHGRKQRIHERCALHHIGAQEKPRTERDEHE